VKKDAKELTQAFGTTPKFAIPVRGVQKTEDGDVKMVTVMLFGDKEQRRKVCRYRNLRMYTLAVTALIS
jgi:hypothetical protein